MNSMESRIVKRCMKWAAFLCCWLLGATLPALAQVQTVTEISGTVADTQGAMISGAQVTLINENTGAVQSEVSNGSGSYSFLSILPGTYSVKATHAGFKTGEVVHRVAQVAQPAIVDFKLEAGQVAETVTVSAVGADLLDTTTAEVSGTIGQKLVENLPLNGRNFLDLATQVPGVNDPGAMGAWKPDGRDQQSFTNRR